MYTVQFLLEQLFGPFIFICNFFPQIYTCIMTVYLCLPIFFSAKLLGQIGCFSESLSDVLILCQAKFNLPGNPLPLFHFHFFCGLQCSFYGTTIPLFNYMHMYIHVFTQKHNVGSITLYMDIYPYTQLCIGAEGIYVQL